MNILEMPCESCGDFDAPFEIHGEKGFRCQNCGAWVNPDQDEAKHEEELNK